MNIVNSKRLDKLNHQDTETVFANFNRNCLDFIYQLEIIKISDNTGTLLNQVLVLHHSMKVIDYVTATILTLLHPKQPKLYGVLAVLSAIRLRCTLLLYSTLGF